MNLKWDAYSDQPAVIKDKALKKRIYKQVRWDSFKLLLTNIFLYPIAYAFYLASSAKKTQADTEHFFGMSVNLDKNPDHNPELTRQLINDLNVNNLLIRIPLHDIENLSAYIKFAEQFKDKNLLFNILQDRRHVEDLDLLKQSLEQIFEQCAHLSHRFQIGNAINRKKWAIFSMDEFLRFYKVAYDLKLTKFPKLKLLGASIIDFEYYFTLRTLFNFHKVTFDECSSLLYVDRRGAPENTQMGLDLTKKLYLLHAMLRLSPKSNSEIVITETNWPITQTHPYAPTSEDDCVSLEKQADYLVRYYLLALATGVVKNVYWHQLIAPGYGLIDNREDKLIKYPAYQAFKTMLQQLQGASLKSFTHDNDLYEATFSNHVKVIWSTSLEKSTMNINKNTKVFMRDGDEMVVSDKVSINGSPIYLIEKNQ